jgi:hypothetical protein
MCPDRRKLVGRRLRFDSRLVGWENFSRSRLELLDDSAFCKSERKKAK